MHIEIMTELLHKAVAAAWDLPAEMQDEIARLVLAYADDLPQAFLVDDGQDAGADQGAA